MHKSIIRWTKCKIYRVILKQKKYNRASLVNKSCLIIQYSTQKLLKKKKSNHVSHSSNCNDQNVPIVPLLCMSQSCKLSLSCDFFVLSQSCHAFHILTMILTRPVMLFDQNSNHVNICPIRYIIILRTYKDHHSDHALCGQKFKSYSYHAQVVLLPFKLWIFFNKQRNEASRL